jgi:hypothetical protein
MIASMPRISDDRLRGMTHFLDRHRAQPDKSMAAYRSERIAELARFVLALQRVYLDTRFWIFLRDAALGRAQKPAHTDLLDTLRAGVASGAMICPLSDSSFFELLRQTDWSSRLSTIKLMDELSLGVTIENAKDRLGTEVLHFLTSTALHQEVPGPPIGRIWLKIGHVLGTPRLVNPGLPAAEQRVIEKAFFDVMWSVTLEESLTDTPLPQDSADARFHRAAARVTAESALHADRIRSFKAVYLAEIGGFWDVHREELGDICETHYRSCHPNAPGVTPEERASAARDLANAFYNIFRLGKAGTSLPTAQIIAGLHAVVRWQKKRAFHFTDYFDFYHAAAALPYCNFFLTERFLTTVLNRPPLSFGDLFGITILCDEGEAIEALRGHPK